MTARRSIALLLCLSLARCVGPAADPRDATLLSVFARADQSLLRARPSLVAGRYARMARGAYDFYRGSLPLFLHDWRDGAGDLSRSRFTLDLPQPWSAGDPHVENFGTLRARDASLALEPNDLDGSDRAPYLWDLRRLTVGLCLAARLSNPDAPDARAAAVRAIPAIVRAAASAYASAIAAHARGAPPARITAGGGDPALEDLFRRAQRDADRGRELTDLTVLTGARRALLRGAPDATDPENVLGELPEAARDALPALLSRYRATLLAPPPAEYFTVLDSAREYGSGVASWPRVRALVLVRGPTDGPGDDVILEVKELADSITPGGPPPGVWFDTVPARLVASARALWALPDADPLWGAGEWLGLPVLVRTESEAHKTLRVDRFVAALGTPDALTSLAGRLGALVARLHAAPLPDGSSVAPAIASVLARDPEGFAQEQADVADRYAARVLADWERFRRVLTERGPSLGMPVDDTDAPGADQRALFGNPPAVRSF